MNKFLLSIFIYTCINMVCYSTDRPFSTGNEKRIILNDTRCGKPVHLVEPIVSYWTISSTITVDFGNQPVGNYTVTISSPLVDVDYYATSPFTTIPIAVDGISDYSIVIETEDGDLFEGTLYASDYTTTATF